MKRYIWAAVFLSFLLFPTSHVIGDNIQEQDELSQLQLTLNEYREDGYDVLGPVQFLGRNGNKVELFQHNPISYRTLDMIDETGDRYYLEKYEFVYVLSKLGNVVLVHVDREVPDNV